MNIENDLVIETLSATPGSLRVALVTETFPPEINGVALTLDNLVKGLLRLGHSVQIVRPRQGAADTGGEPQHGMNQVLAKGMPIPNYPDMRFGLPAGKRLRLLWQQKRPDVVHVATEGPLGWSAVSAARALRLPVTSSFHTNFHQYSKNYGLGLFKTPIEAYLRKLHNRTLATMVPSASVARVLQSKGYKNVSVLSRGVAIERFSPSMRSATLRSHWGVQDEDVVVLYVGRLAKEKNVGVVLSAFAAIQARLPSAKLVFVGQGPLRGALEQACPQAIFVGVKTGAELAQHYASSDLFLFASLTETFGNVVPEALASGLAVVAYDHAAAAMLIRNQDNGILIAAEEELQFINASVALALEHERRAAIRDRAAPSVAHMSWPAIHDTFVNTLRSAIDRYEHAPVLALPHAQMLNAPLVSE